MRGRGSDQGGRWPVGIWFAMVGVSAGTVASFSLIGWTFAKDLYGGGDGAEPLDYDPQTVVIEADETPDPAGVAGGDDSPVGPSGPSGPGPEPRIAVSAAEPQAERIVEADDAEAPPHEPSDERADEPVPEQSTPPQLVPVDGSDGDCGREEADDPELVPDWDDDWNWDAGHSSDYGWDDPGYAEPDLEAALDTAEIRLDLEFDPASDTETDPLPGSGD
ncbi:hypothetical protein [Glycomyces sp. NPDC048151]|uniref:hypothetical protein n=1 Tax=Glycomyces sp. NPDC048151 TaxID=3364002 RepID=UPI00371C9C4C